MLHPTLLPHRGTHAYGSTRAAEGHHLRTARGIVSDLQRPAIGARRVRREGHINSAVRSGCESRTASVGLAKTTARNDARNVQRRSAVIAQGDGLGEARGSHTLAKESQAGRG